MRLGNGTVRSSENPLLCWAPGEKVSGEEGGERNIQERAASHNRLKETVATSASMAVFREVHRDEGRKTSKRAASLRC